MDRADILQQVASGSLSVEDAIEQLKAQPTPKADEPTTDSPLADENEALEASLDEQAAPHRQPRWLRVQVRHGFDDDAHTKVNIRIPFSLVRAGVQFGARFSGRAEWHTFLEAVQNGEVGTLLDVHNVEKGEFVHIILE
ncbi:MAG: hypothetical protein DYG88_18260 [Chloroflexi bacterium CFX4]|nr:hypothetical protein [Chloroflexi bacterium CFX4]MDL1924415.1 DUF2089 domain-containing protein [Chloroflexi bacterium CFX3]